MSNIFNKKPSSENNKYNWKVISILAVFLFISVLFLPASKNFIGIISSKASMLAEVLSSELVLGTNNFRTTNKEAGLVKSSLLTTAAQMKADDMASKGYFSHIAPNGDMPWVWFEKVGYVYSYAGENLAVDFTESADVTEAWINSAKHKANLLNTNFTEIGIGIATGTYEGHQTKFVVQFFGKPFNNVVNKPVLSTIKLSTSTSPITAVATRSDLPDGEVLGTEINNTSQTNDNYLNNPIIIVGSFLVLIIIILKLIVIKREKK